jgi:hypothetical protein
MLGAALSAGAGDRIPAAGTAAETGLFTKKEYKREVTREFAAGADPALDINNLHGNIRIIEGTEGKIMFRIEITGKGRNSRLAREYAETVDIRFSQDGNRISAVTEFKSLSCNNCERTVHYTVVVPKSVSMNLSNTFGNVILDHAAKPLRAKIGHGNLTAHTLDDAAIDIRFGNADIGSCRAATVGSAHSKLKIGRAETIRMDSQFDNIDIGTVSAFDLETKHSTVTVSKLDDRFVATDFDFCKLDISEISTGFGRIKIAAQHSTVKLALDARHSFKAALYTEFGDIDADHLTFSNVSLKKGSAIVGDVGANPNPSATVDIDVAFGDIKFTRQ